MCLWYLILSWAYTSFFQLKFEESAIFSNRKENIAWLDFMERVVPLICPCILHYKAYYECNCSHMNYISEWPNYTLVRCRVKETTCTILGPR